MSQLIDFLSGDIVIQVLGFIGISAGLVSFHMKRRGGILVFQILCCIFFAVQLILLGAYSGAVINIIGIFRGIIYSMRGKYGWTSSRAVPISMIALFIITGVTTSLIEGPLALLPAGAMTVQSIAQFMKDERRIRIISLFGSPLWIVYHVTAGSLGGWLGEIFMMISIAIAIITNEKRDTGTPDAAK